MKKRWLIFAPTFSLIIVFIVASILFVAPAQLFAPVALTTGYVNGTNGDDAWDGSSPTHTGVDIGPKKTIAAGLVAVANRGTLHIAAGTYHENLNINIANGQTLNLIGAGSDVTIIDGNNSGSVMYSSGAGTIILNDLTITHGNAGAQDAGGIMNGNATVKIYDCKIINNTGGSSGGIQNNNQTGNIEIHNTVISGNSSTYNDSMGGGILNYGILTIYNSQILNNSAAMYGGGICNNSETCSIHFSTIANNTATYGAGIYDSSGIHTVYAENNWWGSSSGPSGGIEDPAHASIFANGSGNEISGDTYFYPWLTSNPFASASKKIKTVAAPAAPAPVVAPVWTRTMPMTCYQVWVNSDNMFEMVFWYPYADNNWVKIYDMSGKEVYSVDMPLDNPHIIVDLPNGMYTVKTFNDQPEPLQTFVIGK